MKNKIVVLAVLAVLTSVAQAQSEDGVLGVTVGVNQFNDASGDNTTGYNLGVAYARDITEKAFVQSELHYGTSGDAWGDKFSNINLDLGYKFNVSGYDVKPRIGYTYYDSIGNNTGNGWNTGVEVGISKHLAVDVSYTHFNGRASGINLTGVSLKYNF